MAIPDTAGRIRLKIGKRVRRELLRTLGRKKRVVVKVVVDVSSANGGPSTTYTRKAVVRRPTRR